MNLYVKIANQSLFHIAVKQFNANFPFQQTYVFL